MPEIALQANRIRSAMPECTRQIPGVLRTGLRVFLGVESVDWTSRLFFPVSESAVAVTFEPTCGPGQHFVRFRISTALRSLHLEVHLGSQCKHTCLCRYLRLVYSLAERKSTVPFLGTVLLKPIETARGPPQLVSSGFISDRVSLRSIFSGS